MDLDEIFGLLYNFLQYEWEKIYEFLMENVIQYNKVKGMRQ